MCNRKNAFIALRNTLELYTTISDDTWQNFIAICKFKSVKKHSLIYKIGDIPLSFSYLYKGLVRCFSCNEDGNEYNKVFFDEGKFPGSMTALLTSSFFSRWEWKTVISLMNFHSFEIAMH